MTVADLIARLREYPGEAEVVIPGMEESYPVTWTIGLPAGDSNPVTAVVIGS